MIDIDLIVGLIVIIVFLAIVYPPFRGFLQELLKPIIGLTHLVGEFYRELIKPTWWVYLILFLILGIRYKLGYIQNLKMSILKYFVVGLFITLVIFLIAELVQD